MHQVRRPPGQIIQDMRRIHNGAIPRLGLVLQPRQELGARQDIQIDRDLIQQQHRPRTHQAHGQLHAAALAVAHGAHAPGRVDVQHVHELVAARGVGIAADGAQELVDANVGAHDGVEDPLEPQVGDALEAVLEGVDARDGDGVGGREALAGEEAEEGGFAGAVGADEAGARARGQVERDVADAEGGVLELVGEVSDLY